MISLPSFDRRVSLARALLLSSATLLVACGDDGGETGDGGSSSTTTSSGSTTSASTTTTASTTTSSTTGGEGGGGGDGGAGSGGDGPGAGGGGGADVCAAGDEVADAFSYETDVVAADGVYECQLAGLDESGPTIEITLFCVTDGQAGDVTLRYTPEPALTDSFPFPEIETVTFADLSSDGDDPPVSEGYVLRGQDGRLLFAWIAGSSSKPPLAADDWAAPLSITEVDGVCDADEDGDERRALDVAFGDEAPVRVFSDAIATVGGDVRGYAIRVSENRYNADIDGGFNSLYRYAIVGPQPGDGVCEIAAVESGSACDVDCDAVYDDPVTGGTACTVTCDAEAGCDDEGDFVCVEDEPGAGVCLPSCAEGLACPNGFICDAETTLCHAD